MTMPLRCLSSGIEAPPNLRCIDVGALGLDGLAPDRVLEDGPRRRIGAVDKRVVDAAVIGGGGPGEVGCLNVTT